MDRHGGKPSWERYDENKAKEKAAFLYEARRRSEKTAAAHDHHRTMAKYNVSLLQDELVEMRQRFQDLGDGLIQVEQPAPPARTRRRPPKKGPVDLGRYDSSAFARSEGLPPIGGGPQMHGLDDARALLSQTARAPHETPLLSRLGALEDDARAPAPRDSRRAGQPQRRSAALLPRLDDRRHRPTDDDGDDARRATATAVAAATAAADAAELLELCGDSAPPLAPLRVRARTPKKLRHAKRLLGREGASLNARDLELLSGLLPKREKKSRAREPKLGPVVPTLRRSSHALELELARSQSAAAAPVYDASHDVM